MPNDPRLTPIGRYLRKFSIDEWPQLWNVLRGRHVAGGPAAGGPEEVEQYQRWQRRRLRMRPGLTCLWAVCGRDQLDFETWMKMDMQYIDNWSLALDWKILLRTIPRVLSGPRSAARIRHMHLIPTQEEVVALLRESGALRDGHFDYPNGPAFQRISAGRAGDAATTSTKGCFQRGAEPPVARAIPRFGR